MNDNAELVAEPDEAESSVAGSAASVLEAALWRVAIAAFFFTLLTLFGSQSWYLFDLLANLRLQWLLAIGTGLLLAACLRSLRCIGWFALSAVVSLWPVGVGLSHATPANASGTRSAQAIKVTSINLLSGNQRYEEVLDHLQKLDSDLIAILELTTTWDQRIQERLRASHPYRIASPSDDGNFGIGVYSRLPWSLAEIVYFDSDLPSIEIQLQQSPFRLIATHPVPPMTQSLFERRNLQLWSISQAVNDSPLPTAVVGDLNLTPWSPFFHRLGSDCQLKRVGRWEAFQPTWYAKRDWWPLGLTIDHILITPGLRASEFRVGPAMGSDHRSVTATLQLE